MAKAKWIGGFLGLLSGGPIGALAGFVLGQGIVFAQKTVRGG